MSTFIELHEKYVALVDGKREARYKPALFNVDWIQGVSSVHMRDGQIKTMLCYSNDDLSTHVQESYEEVRTKILNAIKPKENVND